MHSIRSSQRDETNQVKMRKVMNKVVTREATGADARPKKFIQVIKVAKYPIEGL